VDVGAARHCRLHQSQLDRQLFQQRLQDVADLAADEAAEDGFGAQLGGHSRHPHTLPSRVDVDVVPALGGERLDRDREHRVGAEDGDFWFAIHPQRA
jgi:hypothetical protein